MANDKNAVSGRKASPPNEFFRGEEYIYDGGEKAIVSPCGSIFGVKTVKTNALDKGLAEQGGGPNADLGGRSGGKGGRK